jgi:hypothetical protein
VAPVLTLIVAGCGSASSTSSSSAPTATTTAQVPAAPKPKPRLRILSPRAGGRLGETVIVRVRLTGARASGSRPFRYVLDGHRSHRVAARFTLSHLVPGQHRITVALVDDPKVKASRSFVVRRPPEHFAPSPSVQTTPTTTAAPTPTTTTMPAAPPTTTVAPPPPTTTTGGGIPQGRHAGDMDADNHGGPSDGDGNI